MSESNQRAPAGPPSPKAFIGAGIEMAVAIVLFMYVGYRLDGWLASAPWCFVGGALVGVAVAFYGFFKRVRPAGHDDPEG
ncbi:MAG TPA: AtpZ/AtpI family protein [Candidatus Polarisedimenticolaceae bacterium]|nr:AtpZ/AtpI family protein [Candidatus Polarisedimenticolaceae bacterium]